jgi:hypothetical protein
MPQPPDLHRAVEVDTVALQLLPSVDRVQAALGQRN